jgi:hypothetical protein
MSSYYLTVYLQSDATFGRGEGLAGLLDIEIEHDDFGCPFIGGRRLKGLLVEEWANLRFALGDAGTAWDGAAALLFGGSGANTATTAGATDGSGSARLHFGPATLPPDLLAALQADRTMTPARVLAGLTAIRRQTSIDIATGAPEPASLRAARVLLRGTQLIARLDVDDKVNLTSDALGLLAACSLAVRRGGTARNRGRGRLSIVLHDQEPTSYDDARFMQQCFQQFAKQVQL